MTYLFGIELQALGRKEIEADFLPTMTIFVDNDGNYHFSTGIKEIQTAIVDMIPYLSGIYRHPLLFEVQILPGSKIDAYRHSLSTCSFPRFRKRANQAEN